MGSFSGNSQAFHRAIYQIEEKVEDDPGAASHYCNSPRRRPSV